MKLWVYMCVCVCVYALRIENTSESDPHSSEATKTVAKKAQKKILRLQRDYTNKMCTQTLPRKEHR